MSAWQTVEQVRSLAADPVNEFVIVKATEGTSYTSPLYDAQRVAAGTKYAGAYHYSGTPGGAAVEEASRFLAVWDGSGVPALDVETAVTADFVIGWLDHVKQVAGHTPIVYTNWKWLPGLRTGCTVAQWEHLVTFPLWLAEVAAAGHNSTVDAKPGSSKGWPVIIHQYAYTPDGAGNEIDRDWTPDIGKVRAL